MIEFIVRCLVGLVMIMTVIAFMMCGENGYEHTCKKANKCPGSIRCKDEKNMECYEGDDYKW